MNSPERREQTFASPLFPFELKSVQYGLDWMREKIPTLKERRIQIQNMRQTNPLLLDFISQMSALRREINMKEGTLFNGYINGAFFMLNTLEDQYLQRGKLFTSPSFEQIHSYVKDLSEIEFNSEKIRSLQTDETSIHPSHFPIIQDLSRWLDTTEGAALKESFHRKSEIKVHELFNEEPLVKEALTHGKIIQSFGPLDGLKYGALDMYGIFKAQDEVQNLNRMWNIKIK